MTFNEWYQELGTLSAPRPGILAPRHQIDRLLDAGFVFNNRVDFEPCPELRGPRGQFGLIGTPCTVRYTFRRHRTFEMEGNARLNTTSVFVEEADGEMVQIQVVHGNDWGPLVDAVLAYDQG
jgi:hypothetical protein